MLIFIFILLVAVHSFDIKEDFSASQMDLKKDNFNVKFTNILLLQKFGYNLNFNHSRKEYFNQCMIFL